MIPDVPLGDLEYVYNKNGEISRTGTIRLAVQKLIDAGALDLMNLPRTEAKRIVSGWLHKHGLDLVEEGATEKANYATYWAVFSEFGNLAGRKPPGAHAAMLAPSGTLSGGRERLGYVLRRLRDLEAHQKTVGEEIEGLRAEAEQLRKVVRQDELDIVERTVKQWKALGYTAEDIAKMFRGG